MNMPRKGQELRSADGEVWIVLRCHVAHDDPKFFAVDLIRQTDLTQTSRSVNLTWDEFADFCAKQGITLPRA